MKRILVALGMFLISQSGPEGRAQGYMYGTAVGQITPPPAVRGGQRVTLIAGLQRYTTGGAVAHSGPIVVSYLSPTGRWITIGTVQARGSVQTGWGNSYAPAIVSFVVPQARPGTRIPLRYSYPGEGLNAPSQGSGSVVVR